MIIHDWLTAATGELRACGIKSASLDAELLLSFALSRSRECLRAHDEETLNKTVLERADALCAKRAGHWPLAYITHHKEFYGRDFYADENVLIPRPESEQIIDLLRKMSLRDEKILDVGTGSGILAITAQLEFPKTQVIASDISRKALQIAARNTNNLGATINFVQSDLFQNIAGSFDVIIANLPYVSRDWNAEVASPELRKEPAIALFADDNGQALNKRLIRAATNHLYARGRLIMEMDPEQVQPIANYAKNYDFSVVEQRPYHLLLRRN